MRPSLRVVLMLAVLPLLWAMPAAAEINLAAGGHGPSTRMPGNIDSWCALAILLSSLAIAWLLNVRSSKSRALGSALAAGACLAVAGWFFFFVVPSGFLQDPKPNQTPLDSAKPALLWGQAVIALIFGLLLSFAAISQWRSDRELVLGSQNEGERYGRTSRLLHWSIAILFIALIPMGIFASIIPEGTPYRNGYYVVHKTLGVVLLFLIVARLYWNTRSKRPALDVHLKPVERKLAHGVHVLLYIMMLAMPITGFVMTSYHGFPTFFFAWELAPLWEPSDSATIVWGMFHKYLLPYLIYLVLGAHVLGVLKHHYIDRRTASFRRMVN